MTKDISIKKCKINRNLTILFGVVPSVRTFTIDREIPGHNCDTGAFFTEQANLVVLHAAIHGHDLQLTVSVVHFRRLGEYGHHVVTIRPGYTNTLEMGKYGIIQSNIRV